MEKLDIVDLIENNSNIKFSNTYNNNLLEKIKKNLDEEEQKIFLSFFYSYVNYDQKNDYVVDLDNIWKWVGFSQIANAKNLLEKNCTLNIDYK